MRRLLATLLLSLVSFGLIAPLATPRNETQLPPCCRANGKHKCLMGRPPLDRRSDARSVTALSDRCPFSSALASTVAITLHGFTRAAQTAAIPVTIQATGWIDSPEKARTVFSRTRQKRGPPALLS